MAFACGDYFLRPLSIGDEAPGHSPVDKKGRFFPYSISASGADGSTRDVGSTTADGTHLPRTDQRHRRRPEG